ncbi:MAG TPA: hypothetical protein PLG41_03425, partial [Leptospiraceae bacterium]|nr:hypothetical protein [Leptospiraceae bacterium]
MERRGDWTPISTDVLGVVTPVISNLAFAIGLLVGNNAECEKSIWQRKDRFKLDRPLTIKPFEVT